MPEYSRDQILSRVEDDRDASRARKADELLARAKAGDQAALAQLQQLAGDDSTGGWATNDARNYTRMLLEENKLGDYNYSEARDGGGFWGSVKSVGGDLLKYGAPVGAAFIPGIGPLAAAGIAAGGNTAGRAIQGDPFSLKSALLSGAAGAGGNMLLGGQGVGGIKGIPGRLGFGGGAAAPGAPGTGTQSMPGAMGGSAPAGAAGVPGAGFSLGGALDTVGRYGPLAIGALGAYQTMQDQSNANELRERGIKMAEQDYAARAPFRMRAAEFAQRPEPTRQDLSSIFYDEGNPFNRVKRPGGVA
jgi:hypothetical protein